MEEPFQEFIQWWDHPNTQAALREASDYTKAKSAFYAAWAQRAPEPGPVVSPVRPFEVPGQYPGLMPGPGQQSPGWRSGPPPVTRIKDYAFEPGRFDGSSDVGVMPSHPEPGMPGYAEREHREQQRHVETQMMPVVDDTNPGFPATEFTPTVWRGRQEAADGQA